MAKINYLSVAFWIMLAGIIAVIVIYYFKTPTFLYTPINQYIAVPLGNAWNGIQSNPTNIASYVVPAASLGAAGVSIYKFVGEKATKENALAETQSVKDSANIQIQAQKAQYSQQITDLQTQLNDAKNSQTQSLNDLQTQKQAAEIEAATQKKIADAALQKLADGPTVKVVTVIK